LCQPTKMKPDHHNTTDIDPVFLKPYSPAEHEKVVYQLWEDSGYFNPDNLPDRHQEPWSTIMPPPNANGRLHAGHGLDMTLKDIATRFNRMRGKKTLFLPGADHAGFETQVVYEKKLEKEGRSRFNMKPEDLYQEIFDFTQENKKYMEDDVKRLGSSCDWSREKFTLDPDVVAKVQDTFIKMYQDGLIYRGDRTVNWCPKHQTSLSDVETVSVEESQKNFYYLKYGPFIIGTARPETKFGDKYVVVHPEDERYADFKHGQTFEAEWINGTITGTVIKDEVIDMKAGTGAMTITPWHSAIDFEIAQRHDLEMEQIIDWRGKLLPVAGEFKELKATQARDQIIEKLKGKGLVEKIDSNYSHIVKRCYKCNTVIEPQIREQWFVKMKPLADKVVEAVETKKLIKILPDYQKKILIHWMKNTIDWNISRQIIWGIPIPAWFKDGQHHVGYQPPGSGWDKDLDTFDTWFSSGQWPLLTLGYPESPDFKTYHPTDLMETGADLVFKWVPRMIMFSLYFTDEIPFKTVYFHGMVNDEQNKKMSKSKGNVISPMDIIETHGADALRMGLVIGTTAGSSTPLADNKIKAYKHFANKIWNITRFILSSLDNIDQLDPKQILQQDQELIDELDKLTADITNDLENYRFHLASEKLYQYSWHRLADVIIEESKPALNGQDEVIKRSKQVVLLTILERVLIMLHPFMPFVTETIWQRLPHKKNSLLMIEPWPEIKP